jgi:mono/diheme cytochrome c family protein
MTNPASAFVLAAMVIAGSAPYASPVAAQSRSAPAPDGRDLFVAHCASCHGATGRGDGPVAESLRARPADLTQFAIRNGGVFPTARLQRIVDGRDVVAHGTREMPVWGTAFKRTKESLDDPAVRARIDAIVRFLESLQERAG